MTSNLTASEGAERVVDGRVSLWAGRYVQKDGAVGIVSDASGGFAFGLNGDRRSWIWGMDGVGVRGPNNFDLIARIPDDIGGDRADEYARARVAAERRSDPNSRQAMPPPADFDSRRWEAALSALNCCPVHQPPEAIADFAVQIADALIARLASDGGLTE